MIMSQSCLHLHFLLAFLLCCEILASRVLMADDLVVVPFGGCSPDQIKALMEFKSEFDSSGCNHSEFIGVECNIGTGYVTMLQLPRDCLSGTLRHNSSLFKLHQLENLDLSHNNFMSSSLPSKFGSLNKLQDLSLSFSGFIGQVPSSFNNLTQLSSLDLSHNDLTGNFPVVYNLTQLSFLGISHNNFSGTIPSSLFTMPFLEDLDLHANYFTGSIQVPNSSFPSRLKSLRLAYNNFEPQILEPISKLIKLERLDLSSLNISYPVDLCIFSSLKSLVDLDISENSLAPASLNSDSDIPLTLEILVLSQCNITEFPSILKTLVNLQRVDISDNRIKGKIPEWFWKLPRLLYVNFFKNSLNDFEGSRAEILVNSSLQFLDFQFNCFKGAFPNPPLSINILSARGNSFTGSIPPSVCNCKSLTHLYLPYNNFTGPVPHCLSNLKLLSLRMNNLEGSIPDMFYVNSSLRTLDVGYNRLTGKLPRSLLNCSSLRFISVEYNRIEDTFPFWLKALPNLQVLVLRSNKMYGHISTHDQGPLEFPELRVLEIPDNNFTGSLPSNYFAKWNISSLMRNGKMYLGDYEEPYYIYKDYMDLQYKGLNMEQQGVFTFYNAIDFSGNRLEGRIPESIGHLKALVALNLSNNAFTGHIPPSLANVTELQSLDLSKNKLSGNIPNGVKTLSFLVYINVSHNQLKGEIPQGTQIIGQPISCFEWNAGLCGPPLQNSCADTSAPPIQLKQEDEDKDGEVLNWKAVAIGYGPGFLFGLAIAQVIALYKPESLIKIFGNIKHGNR